MQTSSDPYIEMHTIRIVSFMLFGDTWISTSNHSLHFLVLRIFFNHKSSILFTYHEQKDSKQTNITLLFPQCSMVVS